MNLGTEIMIQMASDKAGEPSQKASGSYQKAKMTLYFIWLALRTYNPMPTPATS
jgi:hypothetical protein